VSLQRRACDQLHFVNHQEKRNDAVPLRGARKAAHVEHEHDFILTEDGVDILRDFGAAFGLLNNLVEQALQIGARIVLRDRFIVVGFGIYHRRIFSQLRVAFIDCRLFIAQLCQLF